MPARAVRLATPAPAPATSPATSPAPAPATSSCGARCRNSCGATHRNAGTSGATSGTSTTSGTRTTRSSCGPAVHAAEGPRRHRSQLLLLLSCARPRLRQLLQCRGGDAGRLDLLLLVAQHGENLRQAIARLQWS